MAVPFRSGSSPEDRSRSRRRHDNSSKHSSEATGRNMRRSHHERRKDHPSRRSPPRQIQRSSPYQLPTPLSTPSSSSLCLNLQVEHARSIPMERTPSGNSIVSDNIYEPRHPHTLPCYSDDDAARMVKEHFRQRPLHGYQERYLRNLIDSRSPIDDNALHSIRTAVDSVFFNGALAKRVVWEWSHRADIRYQTELIGTTALRPAPPECGGYETLIVLSAPILKNEMYDRRLALSAFIHELIHCYLFIRCGFDARNRGGHTKGFHEIAKLIDKWVGVDDLRLCNMKANLDYFRLDGGGARDWRGEVYRDERHGHEGCNQSPRPVSGYVDAGVGNGYA